MCGFVCLIKISFAFVTTTRSLSLSRVCVRACVWLWANLFCYRLRAAGYACLYTFSLSLSFSLIIIQALRVPVRVDLSFAQNAELLEEKLVLLLEFLRGGRQRRDGGFCGFGASENLSSFGFEKF